MKRRNLFVIGLLCAAVASLQNVHASIITVTNTSDDGTLPSPGSLRWALGVANDGDTITFSVNGTISLLLHELLVERSVIISGPGANNLTVRGPGHGRVFVVHRNATISGLTITGGFVHGLGGGILNEGGELTITNCRITRNIALEGGGGIANETFGVIIINNSTISSNFAGSGGGILNGFHAAGIRIYNSTIYDNDGQDSGGGIANESRYSREKVLVIDNSTISGNRSHGTDTGGGIWNEGFLIINSSTISGNNFSGGIRNTMGSLVSLANTIIGEEKSQAIINDGAVDSFGYNLCSDSCGGVLRGPGDQINTNPLLGELQNNGGPTLTKALLPGSPAINAGDPSFTPPPEYDQRGPGYPRVVNGRIDIGAFEVQ